jgi:hypothetical protein
VCTQYSTLQHRNRLRAEPVTENLSISEEGQK